MCFVCPCPYSKSPFLTICVQSFFFRTSGQDNVQLFSQQQLERLNVQLQQVDEDTAHERSTPRHLRNKMETGAEMRPAICFWDRYWGRVGQLWGIFLPCPLSLVTVPVVFMKVNSLQFPSRFWRGETHGAYSQLPVIQYNTIFFI